jgi:hypothetical protein
MTWLPWLLVWLIPVVGVVGVAAYLLVKRFSMKALCLVFTGIACAFGFLSYLLERERIGDRLELVVASLPSGITTAEADRLLGGPPDRISRHAGVLVNGVTFLSAENSKAKEHGGPQLYELRTWQRGAVNATVIIDHNGFVAGRYTWK